MKKVLETERLYLREMTENDLADLALILQDPEVMYAYEHAFSDAEVRAWLEKQLANYRNLGFGLWAVVLKENDVMVGQCGLTMQPVLEREVLEIGYLFKRAYWHQGYASEAAQACKEYAFSVLGAPEVYSIIRDTNLASQRVAERNGMHVADTFVKHYYNVDMPHYLYMVENIE